MFGVKLLSVGSIVLLAALPWPLSWFCRRDDAQANLHLLVKEAEAVFRGEDTHWVVPPDGRFHMAAWLFETIRRERLENPGLYHNLGNAYFLADQAPKAIRSYDRGLRLEPAHRRLQENLEYARNQVQYPTPETRPPSPGWPPWLPFPSPDLLLLLTLVLHALACVSFTRWLMVRSGLRRTVLLAGLALTLSLSAWLLLQQQLPDTDRPLIVITQDNTAFCLGNGASYFPRHPQIPSLPRGLEARRLHQRGDWMQIQLASGDVGWVHRQYAIVDE